MKNTITFVFDNLFIAIPLTIFGWYSYLTGSAKSTFSLVFIAGFTLIVILRMRFGLQRAAAAGNVVAGKATYEQLGDTEKAKIHNYAIEIIRRSGWRSKIDPTFKNDVERFGWYALSMMELGIKPLPIIPGWMTIKNPWIPIDDSQLDTALKLARKEGFDVSLSRETKQL